MEIHVESHADEAREDCKEKILAALEAVGLLCEGYAQVNLTQSGAVDTGFLRNSITHKVIEEEEAAYIGTNTEYAPFIEFGTGIYYAGGRRTSWTYKDRDGNWHLTNGMRARPYLKPAVADHQSEIWELAGQYLK